MSTHASERVRLDRRIAEEGMHELDPHGQEPPFAAQWSRSEQPRVWTMDAAGVVSRDWRWLDRMDWHDVVAVRVEGPYGLAIDVASLECGDDEGYGGW